MSLEIPFDDDAELLAAHAQTERAAWGTHKLIAASQSAFLCGHGLSLACAGAKFGGTLPWSWEAVMTFVWVGDCAAALLLVWSWFASCPYVRLCLAERRTKVGERTPSLLTDIAPQMVAAGAGLVVMILVILAELSFAPNAEKGAVDLDWGFWALALVSVLCVLHSCCFRAHDHVLGLGGAVALASALLLACGVRGGVLALPPCLGAAALAVRRGLALAAAHNVLKRRERLLRLAELALLAVLAFVFLGDVFSSEPDWPGTLVMAGLGGVVLSGLRFAHFLMRLQYGSVEMRLVDLLASPATLPDFGRGRQDQWSVPLVAGELRGSV